MTEHWLKTMAGELTPADNYGPLVFSCMSKPGCSLLNYLNYLYIYFAHLLVANDDYGLR